MAPTSCADILYGFPINNNVLYTLLLPELHAEYHEKYAGEKENKTIGASEHALRNLYASRLLTYIPDNIDPNLAGFFDIQGNTWDDDGHLFVSWGKPLETFNSDTIEEGILYRFM